MIGFAFAGLLFGLTGWGLFFRLDVSSRERTPALAVVGIATFGLGVGLSAYLLTGTGLALYEAVLTLVTFPIGATGVALGTVAAHLWLLDHTSWGQFSAFLIELNAATASLARQKPLSWLTPLFVPKTFWTR